MNAANDTAAPGLDLVDLDVEAARVDEVECKDLAGVFFRSANTQRQERVVLLGRWEKGFG